MKVSGITDGGWGSFLLAHTFCWLTLLGGSAFLASGMWAEAPLIITEQKAEELEPGIYV